MSEAGSLDKRITIQRTSGARDALGGIQQDWSTWRTVWGSIEPLAGDEALDAGGKQEVAAITTRIRTRYIRGLTEAMRLVYAGQVYQIRAVKDTLMRHEDLEILCEAVK